MKEELIKKFKQNVEDILQKNTLRLKELENFLIDLVFDNNIETIANMSAEELYKISTKVSPKSVSLSELQRHLFFYKEELNSGNPGMRFDSAKKCFLEIIKNVKKYNTIQKDKIEAEIKRLKEEIELCKLFNIAGNNISLKDFDKIPDFENILLLFTKNFNQKEKIELLNYFTVLRLEQISTKTIASVNKLTQETEEEFDNNANIIDKIMQEEIDKSPEKDVISFKDKLSKNKFFEDMFIFFAKLRTFYEKKMSTLDNPEISKNFPMFYEDYKKGNSTLEEIKMFIYNKNNYKQFLLYVINNELKTLDASIYEQYEEILENDVKEIILSVNDTLKNVYCELINMYNDLTIDTDDDLQLKESSESNVNFIYFMLNGEKFLKAIKKLSKESIYNVCTIISKLIKGMGENNLKRVNNSFYLYDSKTALIFKMLNNNHFIISHPVNMSDLLKDGNGNTELLPDEIEDIQNKGELIGNGKIDDNYIEILDNGLSILKELQNLCKNNENFNDALEYYEKFVLKKIAKSKNIPNKPNGFN